MSMKLITAPPWIDPPMFIWASVGNIRHSPRPGPSGLNSRRPVAAANELRGNSPQLYQPSWSGSGVAPRGREAVIDVMGRVLVGFNQTNRPFPLEETVVDLFERQSEKTPDAVAARFRPSSMPARTRGSGSVRITRRSSSTCSTDFLLGQEVGVDEIVTLFGARGPEVAAVVAALAPDQRIDDLLGVVPRGAGVPQRQRGDPVGVHVLRGALQLGERRDRRTGGGRVGMIDFEQQCLVGLHDQRAVAHPELPGARELMRETLRQGTDGSGEADVGYGPKPPPDRAGKGPAEVEL